MCGILEYLVSLFPTHADGWVAFWTAILSLVTIGLAYMVYWQVGCLREDAKQARTILACERYDLDPLLQKAASKLDKIVRTKKFVREAKKYKSEITLVLNYLEQLAIGCNCNVYHEGLLKTFMREIFRGHIKDLVDSGAAAKTSDERDPREFEVMLALSKKWESSGISSPV